MTAFIDTMVLIWWVRREASTGQSEMIKRADWLMTELEVNKAEIMVSAISVAEFLRGSNSQDRAGQNAIIEESFICRPFDAHVAHVLASEFHKVRSVEEYEGRATALKADAQIVATAVAGKADVLYSHDVGVRKLAEACGVEARDLPLGPPTLFD